MGTSIGEEYLFVKPKILQLGLMQLLEAVAKLKGEGKTILLVEQKVREALEVADRAYVLQTGRTIYKGTGDELLETDIVKKAFLGL